MPRRGESKTSPRKIARAEKVGQAVALRKRGKDYDYISKVLGVSHGTVAKWVADHMKALPQEAGADLRKIEIERLDQLLDAMWDKAMKGDGWAVDRCVKIMERKAKLAGIDAPVVTKVEVVPPDVVDKQISELEREVRMMKALESSEQSGTALNVTSERVDKQAGGE